MALSVGLFASGWPEHIRAHPYWVAIAFLVGAFLMALGFIWPAKEKSGIPVQFVGSGNLVGRDNSGKMIGNVEHYHEAPGARPTPAPEIPRSIVSEPVSKGIEFEMQFSWANLVYELSPGLWRRAQSYDNEYKRVLVVWFTNPLPMKGKPVERELPVLAHINLRNPAQGITEQIPTAYWVEEMGYQVNLGMGYNRGVMLGHIENRRFYSHINPYPYPGLNNDFDIPLRQLGEGRSVPLSDRIVIQASIIKIDADESIIEQVSFDVFPQTQGGWGVSRAN
jgi:hypothetical protein